MNRQAVTTRGLYPTHPGIPEDLADIQRLWIESAKLVDFCRDPSAIELLGGTRLRQSFVAPAFC